MPHYYNKFQNLVFLFAGLLLVNNEYKYLVMVFGQVLTSLTSKQFVKQHEAKSDSLFCIIFRFLTAIHI